MKGDLWGIYGCGGCGRGIMPLAREMLRRHGHDPEGLVFIDDEAPNLPERVNGHRVFTYAEFRAHAADRKFAGIAVAGGETRARLAAAFDADGIGPWTVVASNIVIMDDVEILPGALISPFVTLTSNLRIGRHFHCNLYSYVEHDCRIGDFVTFGPGAKCNGNVVIEDFAYIGSGAVIRQGQPGKPLVIGRGAVVGMGAVVTKDVPAGVTVAGNPARQLTKPFADQQ